jgi:hypothetical protein
MSGMAYGPDWKGRCSHRPNRIREDHFFCTTRYVAYQCVRSENFLLLQLQHPIYRQPLLAPGDGPIALVLAPTRELAVQIQQECTKFG